jgi:hypothetical protein
MRSKRDELIFLLRNYSFSKRRDAVLSIRKSRDRSLGPPLFEAFKRESKVHSNWENQYHMIMALSELDYRPAFQYLRDLSMEKFEATLLYTALGEAMIRLGRLYDNDPTPFYEILHGDNFILLDGAFRAVVRLNICFEKRVILDVIDFADRIRDPGTEPFRRYAEGGADPEWQSPNLLRFLRRCMEGSCEETSAAAKRVLYARYLA